MKKIILSLLFSFYALLCIAQQPNEVTLVVSGDGATKEEATKNALRYAIEQAYGVFVSANTELLNDEVVKDEVATIASGNIKSFKELSSQLLPNGMTTITLSAEVSIGKLVSYVKSKGGSAEFAGQTFMMEMKMQKLNKENELSALKNIISELKLVYKSFYDCSIEVKDAKMGSVRRNHAKYGDKDLEGYIIPVRVSITANHNYEVWLKGFLQTLGEISIKKEAIKDYESKNIPFFEYQVFGNDYYFRNNVIYPKGKDFAFSFFEDVATYLNDCLDTKRWAISINSIERFYPFIPQTQSDYYKIDGDIYFKVRGQSHARYYLVDSNTERFYSYSTFEDYRPRIVDARDGNLEYDPVRMFLQRTKEAFPVTLPLELFLTENEIEQIRTIEVSWVQDNNVDKTVGKNFEKNETNPIVKQSNEEPISFVLVEIKPSFKNNDSNAFTDWVRSQIVYPDSLKGQGYIGRTVVEFIVETDGTVTNVALLRGSGHDELDNKVLDIVRSSPKWEEPGMNAGAPVRVSYKTPIVLQSL